MKLKLSILYLMTCLITPSFATVPTQPSQEVKKTSLSFLKQPIEKLVGYVQIELASEKKVTETDKAELANELRKNMEAFSQAIDAYEAEKNFEKEKRVFYSYGELNEAIIKAYISQLNDTELDIKLFNAAY